MSHPCLRMRFLCTDPGGIAISLFVYVLLATTTMVAYHCVLMIWFRVPQTTKLTPLGSFLFLWWILILGLAVVSHVRCMLSDPGFVPKLKVEPKNAKACRKCENWKPLRSHHCRSCRRCVHLMDHHCPWVNNCVGFGNQKYFILFLLYVSALSAYAIGLLSTAGYFYYNLPPKLRTPTGPPTLIVFGCGLLGLVSGFFLFFCCSFLSEQYEAISTNTTLVETYQFCRGEKPGNFSAVLGSKFWLLPINTLGEPDYDEGIIKEQRRACHHDVCKDEDCVVGKKTN